MPAASRICFWKNKVIVCPNFFMEEPFESADT